MNILFVSISSVPHMSKSSISLDLLREFRKNGHNVYVVCSVERTDKRETGLSEEAGCKVLRVKIGKNKKANLIEKGLTTLFLPQFYINAIKKNFADVKFDLVMYPTPPVTHASTVKYIKKRDGAISYLLLKDIFPQNAVDIKMFSKKSIIYKYFRWKEISLYKMSDYIGCMSQANVDYLLRHNPYINKEKVHVSPNSIELIETSKPDKSDVRNKFGIPHDAKAFIYGGNLGKPQGIPFLIDCLKENAGKKDRFFVISGKGTEYSKIKKFYEEQKPDNMLLINGLPKDEYDQLVSACDVGLIFLDHRFTIPNFPSRLLSYMNGSMPVLAATDPNTDVGKVIEDGDFGWWCESDDVQAFTAKVDEVCGIDNLMEKGENALEYLKENYTVEKVYGTIMENIKADKEDQEEQRNVPLALAENK